MLNALALTILIGMEPVNTQSYIWCRRLGSNTEALFQAYTCPTGWYFVRYD